MASVNSTPSSPFRSSIDQPWGAQSALSARREPRQLKKVEARSGLVLEVIENGWVGAVVGVEKSGGIHVVQLEDARGRVRAFPLGFGFLLEGEPVQVLAPRSLRAEGPTSPARTASGSVKSSGARARVAKASRIWVEGKHDAQLVEKVWGDDLREVGIVVEELSGIDDLEHRIADFGPGSGRRLGVLVDHLVPGSKETRIAETAMKVPGARGNVLILGHPYVDVWETIKPERVGISAWPTVPRSMDYKTGILQHLGWPHRDHRDIAQGWARLLATVNSYLDLTPALLGRVEELIDFLTEDGVL